MADDRRNIAAPEPEHGDFAVVAKYGRDDTGPEPFLEHSWPAPIFEVVLVEPHDDAFTRAGGLGQRRVQLSAPGVLPVPWIRREGVEEAAADELVQLPAQSEKTATATS
jgi:hypothetical protein